MDHDVVSKQPGLGVTGASDLPGGDQAPSRSTELRHLEDLADFGGTDLYFFDGRIKQAGHRLLDLVGHVVDDAVEPNVDLLALRHGQGVPVWSDIEPDDDRVRCRREDDIALVDGPGATAEQPHSDALVTQLAQGIGEHLG